MDTPDSSTTPPLPDTPDSGGEAASQTKKRRQVAFYPNMNSTNKPQKPFSRSAAKRESVMALGSIEYLQHYFTKTGISAQSECVLLPYLSPPLNRFRTPPHTRFPLGTALTVLTALV